MSVQLEYAQLVMPTIHKNEYRTRPGILVKDIANVVYHCIPLIAETHITLAILVSHTCRKTKHNYELALNVGQWLSGHLE